MKLDEGPNAHNPIVLWMIDLNTQIYSLQNRSIQPRNALYCYELVVSEDKMPELPEFDIFYLFQWVGKLVRPEFVIL